MKDIPGTIYIVFGEGEDRASLEALIAKLGLQEKVFLPGHVENAYLLLPGADIFMLSSLKEGLPYVIFEAAHAGLPVLATRVGGIPDIIEDRVSGLLVHPRAPREIESCLCFMIEHPAERMRYGKQLQQKITKELPAEKMIASTVAVYTE
jgi:glycosyltransferase involved in cell wall biosynthesis